MIPTIVNITNSYWNKNAPQSVDGGVTHQSPRARGDTTPDGSGGFLDTSNNLVDVSGATGLTLAEFKAITATTTGSITTSYPSGLLSPMLGIGDAWHLGTASQLPAIKQCVNPTIVPSIMRDSTTTVMCASYGALLAGQRP